MGLKGKAVIYLTLARVALSTMEKQSGNSRGKNEQRLRNLPFEKQCQRCRCDEDCRNVGDRSPRKHSNSARDCSSCRCSYALHKGTQLRIAGKFLVERPRN